MLNWISWVVARRLVGRQTRDWDLRLSRRNDWCYLTLLYFQVGRHLHVVAETGSILGKLISSSPNVTSCLCRADQAGIGWAVGPFCGKCSRKIPEH